MAFFKFKSKEQKEQEKRIQEQKAKEAAERTKYEEARQLASQHRRGGEDILNALDSMYLKCDNGEIEDTVLATYQVILKSFKAVLKSADTLALDTTDIDAKIVQMITLMDKAIQRGAENTANELMRILGECIKVSRGPIQETSEEYEGQILKARIEKVNRLSALAEMMEDLNAKEDSIKKFDEEINSLKEKAKVAQTNFSTALDENIDIRDAFNDIVVNGGEITGRMLELESRRLMAVRTYNNLKKAQQAKGTLQVKVTALENDIQGMKLQLLGITEQQSRVSVEQLTNFQETYAEYLTASIDEIAEMDKLEQHFNNMIEAIYSNQKLVDHFIASDLAYMKMEQEMKEEEDAKRMAVLRKKAEAIELENKKKQQELEEEQKLENEVSEQVLKNTL